MASVSFRSEGGRFAPALPLIDYANVMRTVITQRSAYFVKPTSSFQRLRVMAGLLLGGEAVATVREARPPDRAGRVRRCCFRPASG
ncbi:hypothetical protein GCM10007904_33600 [Oharaeibacter diazotrophicus]|nr:hypothetical protein GCM10007904_33600 [Oharaeibacter diazotrophicus]